MNDADLQAAKNQMLRKQLRRRGITDSRVLSAMAKVPREQFVPADARKAAYADQALAIDCDQTISQPFMVGLMTQALQLTGNERVLEIGTGSGYQTSVLAELAREVISVERHVELSQRAAAVLTQLGYQNVTLVIGDGTRGWPDRAPYDRILVTAAAAECPPPLFEQLREGGLLVIPLGGRDQQVLQVICKTDGLRQTAGLTACRFVPLVGECGWEA